MKPTTQKQIDTWITKVAAGITRAADARAQSFNGGEAGDPWHIVTTDGHRALLTSMGSPAPKTPSVASRFRPIMEHCAHGATITPEFVAAVRQMKAANTAKGGYLFLTGDESSIRFATMDADDQTQAATWIDCEDAPRARVAVSIKYLSEALIVGATVSWSFDSPAIVITPPTVGYKLVIMCVRASEFIPLERPSDDLS